MLMGDILRSIKNPIVLDIGANVGHHTLYASTVADHVHAFEPYGPVRAQLEEKIKLNGLKNVTVHAIGLGAENDLCDFYPPDSNNMGTGSFVPTDTKNPMEHLEVRIGDDYLNIHEIDKIDFIKMDVEGFEVRALSGLQNVLCRHRPVCFFEWNQGGENVECDNPKELFPRGYEIFRFVEEQTVLGLFRKQGYGLKKVSEYSKYRNYLAVSSEFFNRICDKESDSQLRMQFRRLHQRGLVFEKKGCEAD